MKPSTKEARIKEGLQQIGKQSSFTSRDLSQITGLGTRTVANVLRRLDHIVSKKNIRSQSGGRIRNLYTIKEGIQWG